MSVDPTRDALWSYLDRQDLPDGHRGAWDWFRSRIPWYPLDRKYPPWRQGRRADRWRRLAMVGFAPAVPEDGTKAVPASCRVVIGRHDDTLEIGEGDDGALALAARLFGPHTARSSLVVLDGTAWAFDGLLVRCGRAWVRAGYVVQPLVAGHAIKAIIVRHGRHRWTLCDFEAMTGTPPDVAMGEAVPGTTVPPVGNDPLRHLLAWLTALQDLVLRDLGAYLRPTVGGTSVRAATFGLPSEAMIPRPAPHLVALCREGRAFRGGYIYGERYRGEAYKADVRRMYAWALSQPLGYRWAVGPCLVDGDECPGIYLCTVSGTASHPVQLATWRGPAEGFTAQLWASGTAIAVLPTSELPGLRALGLTVEPSFGWVATATLTFATYIDRLARLGSVDAPDGPAARFSKLAANVLYGRLAVNPHREGIAYSEDRPSETAFPLVTLDGVEIEDMWAIEALHYAPSQQVAIAAMVTGYARSRLYQEMALRIAEGRSIVHAHTDGLVVTGSPPADMPTATAVVGAWRLVSADADTIVARAGGYAIGGEAKWSGAPSRGRRTIEVAWNAGDWIVRGLRTRKSQAV